MEESKSLVITREELYRQVWTTPMSRLCERYGLSDNGLRKICIKLAVPWPPLGYWAKAQAGKPVRRTRLPPHKGQTEARLPARPANLAGSFTPVEQAVQKEIRGLERDITVPGQVDRWDRLVAQTRRELEKRDRRVVALWDLQIERHLTGWYRNRFNEERRELEQLHAHGGIVVPSSSALDLWVTRERRERALLILNALMFELAKIGYPVTVRDGKTTVEGAVERWGIRLSEDVIKRPNERDPGEQEWHATGLFRLSVRGISGGDLVIRDTGNSLLEFQLSRLLQFLQIKDAQAAAEQRDHLDRETISGDEAVGREEDSADGDTEGPESRTCVDEAEVERRKQEFLHETAAWHEATRLRQYVEAVQARGRLTGVPVDAIQQWADWALGLAAALDPIPQRLAGFAVSSGDNGATSTHRKP